MSITVDMPAIDQAINAESYEWLQDNAPELADAIAAEIGRNRTPEQIRQYIARRVGAHRAALVWRCHQAASYMQNGGD